MPLPESHLRIHGKDNCIPTQPYIHKEVYHYFDKRLCLDHGWVQRILPEMLSRLASALSSELAPSYDPENESKVAEVLSRMNFNLPQTNGKPAKSRKQS